MKVGHKPASRTGGHDGRTRTAAPARRRGQAEAPTGKPKRRPTDGPARPARTRTRPQEPRGLRQGPQTVPAVRPADRPARPTGTSQAKARAKARKAKAPKVIRTPLRERLLARVASIDLSPRTLIAKVPFVVLVIGALALGLGITLWLSTDAAQRSYQLGSARALNDALLQQKESLERDVLAAQSAPALADAARNLGMIPSRDTAHLIQDPAGNWVVIGQPKAAEGVSPPPLNSKLPDEMPPAPANKPAAPLPAGPRPGLPGGAPAPAGPEVPVLTVPPASAHASGGTALPGPAPVPGSAALPGMLPLPGALALPGALPLPGTPLPGTFPLPTGDTLAVPPAGLPAPAVPTVANVPPVTDVTAGVPLAGPGE